MQFIHQRSAMQKVHNALAHAELIALDTEAAGYHRYDDRLCVLQLTTREETFVVDALAVDISTIGSFLADPDNEVVLHDADYDLRLLRRDHDIALTRLFDTRIAAQFLGETVLGLAGLAARHLGVRLDKKHQRADWARRPLPQEWIEYAADDTRHLPALRDALRAGLERAGRLEWAEEEFRIREATRPAPAENGDAWLRLKNTRDLGRRQLAALRELHAWREEVARARDVATFRVIGNDVLVAIARAMPGSEAALAATEGMPSSLAARYGRDLLEAVRRAAELPGDALPVRVRGPRRPPPDPEFDALVERLKRERDRVADELGLDRGFLMPRQQLEDMARLRPGQTNALRKVPEMREWQIDAVGERLLQVLRR
ncbi:MAG: HRDC domain-containing protein [Gemmatimonadetes bacterium]|nr:HRDC domain-containing protein [Gemmatimonadota bacterium]